MSRVSSAPKVRFRRTAPWAARSLAVQIKLRTRDTLDNGITTPVSAVCLKIMLISARPLSARKATVDMPEALP
jgi:hypothetical protein